LCVCVCACVSLNLKLLVLPLARQTSTICGTVRKGCRVCVRVWMWTWSYWCCP
jgi:hypothetical protein